MLQRGIYILYLPVSFSGITSHQQPMPGGPGAQNGKVTRIMYQACTECVPVGPKIIVTLLVSLKQTIATVACSEFQKYGPSPA